jgi:hypothetical protein
MFMYAPTVRTWGAWAGAAGGVLSGRWAEACLMHGKATKMARMNARMSPLLVDF